jgi:hypothetical protein
MTYTLTLNETERAAIGYALDLAHNDQEHYLDYGAPDVDYGPEWPETAREKAAGFIVLGQIGESLGFHGERDRWTELANAVLETIGELGHCVNCGERCIAGGEGSVICPKCAELETAK